MKDFGNKGFSFIEVIIAMAVAAIMIGSITLFIYQGTRNYKLVQNELDLQMEGQMLMGQIGDIVLEGSYAEYLVDEKCLLVYRIDEENQEILTKDVIWLGEGNHLYLVRYPGSRGSDPREMPDLTAPDKKELFGEYVKDFQAKTEKEKVTISLILEVGEQSYSLENQIKMRNRYVEWPILPPDAP